MWKEHIFTCAEIISTAMYRQRRGTCSHIDGPWRDRVLTTGEAEDFALPGL